MLQALDTQAGKVLATDADKGSVHLCPECRGPVVLKRGRLVIAHFAHAKGAGCAFGTGESIRHHQMKASIGHHFADYAPEYEAVVVPGRRADVTFLGGGRRYVVECQESPMSIEEWEQRTADYSRYGMHVLWVWDLWRLAGKGKTIAGLCSVRGIGEQRVAAEVRHCHSRSYGRVYVLDTTGDLRACHLEAGYTRMVDSGPSWDGGAYTPRTLKYLNFQPTQLEPSAFINKHGERLVQLGEGVWWK